MNVEQPRSASDRPRLVTYAVYLIYLSAVLQILPDPFALVRGRDLSEAGPLTLPCLFAPAVVILLIAFAFGRAILHRSNIARILFTILFLLGLVLWIPTVSGWVADPTSISLLVILGFPSIAARFVAVVLLFFPVSNAWFRKKSQPETSAGLENMTEPTVAQTGEPRNDQDSTN